MSAEHFDYSLPSLSTDDFQNDFVPHELASPLTKQLPRILPVKDALLLISASKVSSNHAFETAKTTQVEGTNNPRRYGWWICNATIKDTKSE
jgi:hypothetical protein